MTKSLKDFFDGQDWESLINTIPESRTMTMAMNNPELKKKIETILENKRGKRCNYCKKMFKLCHNHHIVPKKFFPKDKTENPKNCDHKDNMIIICVHHHKQADMFRMSPHELWDIKDIEIKRRMEIIGAATKMPLHLRVGIYVLGYKNGRTKK